MPGRQRLAPRKIAAIERRLEGVFADFLKAIPALYRDRLLSRHPLSRQPLCAAWGDAWSGITAAHTGLDALRKMLEERAAALPAPPACPFVEASVVEDQRSSQLLS